ncbi:uncharacterized protein WM277_018144 [Molossus nigricans]
MPPASHFFPAYPRMKCEASSNPAPARCFHLGTQSLTHSCPAKPILDETMAINLRPQASGQNADCCKPMSFQRSGQARLLGSACLRELAQCVKRPHGKAATCSQRSPNPQCGRIWKQLSHEGGAQLNGISALTRRAGER